MQFHIPPDVATDKDVQGIYSISSVRIDSDNLSKSMEEILISAIILKGRGWALFLFCSAIFSRSMFQDIESDILAK